MFKKQCVYLSLVLILIPSTLLSQGGQMAILKVTLNHEEKGEFFIYLTEDGDYLIKTEDLKKMGLLEAKGKTSLIEEEEFISLRSIQGVRVEFDEKRLALIIHAEPSLFGKKVFSMRYPKYPKIYYPKDTAGFLNYNLTYYGVDRFKYEQTQLANQLGFRRGDFLFLTDSSYSQRKGERAKFVRLMSHITYDRREDLLRAVLGDSFGTSGDLGSTINIGGISFSKNYLIDPYFIKYPEVNFSGLVSLPSEVEIYRDGILIQKGRISPGEVFLKDIPTYVGSGMIEVVLRDPFGREQRVFQPYYFTDRLLKKGLQEFSYHLGFQRKHFGIESNQYEDLTFLGYHRYGLYDSLTAGARGEASEKVINLGFSSTLLLPLRMGVLDASVAWSVTKGRNYGLGGMVNYLYQGRNLSLHLLLRGFTKDYSNVSLLRTKERIKFEIDAGAGYHSQWLGSFSIGFSQIKTYQGIDKKNVFAGYARKFIGPSTLSVTFKRDLETHQDEFLLSFNYHFKHGIAASVGHQRINGTYNERVQVIKNLPVGEGFGGRVSLDLYHGKTNENYGSTLQMQYNARYGQYGGEFIRLNHQERYSLMASGGLSFIKDSLNFSRPIQDSYAVVKVGDLKGVRVFLNSQEVGKTDSSGKVLIPNLGSYYDSQISINDKDVPMDYILKEVVKYLNPPLRSGSYIEFPAKKFQAFYGILKLRKEEEIRPLEYIEFKLFMDGEALTLPTGKGGEFYFENVKPGIYKGELIYLDKKYVFDIIVPKSEEIIVDLGEVICK